MWEVISAISAAISALCDVRGARAHKSTEERPEAADNPPHASSKEPSSFLRLCGGWCLIVISFLCIEQPYGSHLSDREIAAIFGWIIAGPAFLCLLHGLERANGVATAPETKGVDDHTT